MKRSNEYYLDMLRTAFAKLGRSPAESEVTCRGSFVRRFGSWNAALERAGLPVRFIQGKPRPIISCMQCGAQTKNPRFCSQACAATYNNHSVPKRKKSTPLCPSCNANHLVTIRNKVCASCREEQQRKLDERTLAEVTYYQHRSGKYALIRGRARYQYTDELAAGCHCCRYPKHLDVCHITPISRFPPETLIKEINSRENIVILCKRCHWEFDHKELPLEQIPYWWGHAPARY